MSAAANSQTLTDSLLVGRWTAEAVLKKPSNPHYRDIIDSFKASTFIFNEDRTFELRTDANSQDFATIRKQTKGKTWKFDQPSQTIKIGDAKGNFSAMHIKVKSVDGKTVFVLPESQHQMQLEMVKYIEKKK